MEHINLLLDDLIVNDIAKRHPVVTDMPMEARQLRHLIEGGYAPRSSHVPHACKYCGKGTYELVLEGPHQTQVAEFGFNVTNSSTALYALRCNYCGHIEFFRPNNGHWWGPRHPLNDGVA